MFNTKKFEITVGFFILFSLFALLVLALKVSGLGLPASAGGYEITAVFDNIGGLKVRSPVTLSGVRVGEVARIQIDPKSFKALVKLRINEKQNSLPVDTTASIYTQGLLGSNYISLTPGFDEQAFLKNGSRITNTHSAIILEALIGQLLFNLKNSDKT